MFLVAVFYGGWGGGFLVAVLNFEKEKAGS